MQENNNLISKISNFSNEELENISNDQLIIVEEDIKNIINFISKCNSREEARPYFDILEKWQFLTSKMVFKFNAQASDYLGKFTRDFDRLDDIDLRKHLFKEIKAGKYA